MVARLCIVDSQQLHHRPRRCADGQAGNCLSQGALGPGAETLADATAITIVQPIVDRPTDLATAMADTDRLLEAAAGRLARTVGVGQELARP